MVVLFTFLISLFFLLSLFADGAPAMDTGSRKRALELLGTGMAVGIVASAVGVDHSYISQLLANEEFAKEVAELRFKNLQSHTLRDERYNQLEDYFVERIDEIKECITRPADIFRAAMLLNKAQRRGQVDPSLGQEFKAVVKLSIPQVIQAQFQVDASGIIISVGTQEMLTMPSNVLLKEIHGERLDSDGKAAIAGPAEAFAIHERTRSEANVSTVLSRELEAQYGI